MLSIDILKKHDVEWITEARQYDGIPIAVNGVIVAYTTQPDLLYKELKEAKRKYG